MGLTDLTRVLVIFFFTYAPITQPFTKPGQMLGQYWSHISSFVVLFLPSLISLPVHTSLLRSYWKQIIAMKNWQECSQSNFRWCFIANWASVCPRLNKELELFHQSKNEMMINEMVLSVFIPEYQGRIIHGCIPT